MSRYFVWRYSDDVPYRVYGLRRYFEPEPGDPRCIWRGESYREALEAARAANAEGKAQKAGNGRQLAFQ